jgi:hypothetical protein
MYNSISATIKPTSVQNVLLDSQNLNYNFLCTSNVNIISAHSILSLEGDISLYFVLFFVLRMIWTVTLVSRFKSTLIKGLPVINNWKHISLYRKKKQFSYCHPEKCYTPHLYPTLLMWHCQSFLRLALVKK